VPNSEQRTCYGRDIKHTIDWHIKNREGEREREREREVEKRWSTAPTNSWDRGAKNVTIKILCASLL
jgi:hypothetical protein